MKIKTIKRATKREPRIIYSEPARPLKSSIIERVDPTKGQGVDYEDTNGQANSSSGANCTGGASSNKLYRLCYLRKYLKSSGIKYVYYTGHKYSASQVIQKKQGNCCDLARLCATILTNTGLPTATAGHPISDVRYCIGIINYSGQNYNHVWLEVETNTTDTSNDTYTATGKDTCGRGAYVTVTKTYRDYCPNCGKSGVLGNAHKSDCPESEGQITCLKSKGGCDSDFCIYDGWDKNGTFRSRLSSANQTISTYQTFDPTNYITTGSQKVLGKSDGNVTHKSTGVNPC